MVILVCKYITSIACVQPQWQFPSGIPQVLTIHCREKAVFAIHAHVFQIDPETKKKWLPSSTASVRVAYYHDPSRKTYRIIAIENNKVCMLLG